MARHFPSLLALLLLATPALVATAPVAAADVCTRIFPTVYLGDPQDYDAVVWAGWVGACCPEDPSQPGWLANDPAGALECSPTVGVSAGACVEDVGCTPRIPRCVTILDKKICFVGVLVPGLP